MYVVIYLIALLVTSAMVSYHCQSPHIGLIPFRRAVSYMIDQGICYLTLTERSYPKRLAFLFLEEIARDFEADLRDEYGEE